jgi:hypothetical protein
MNTRKRLAKYSPNIMLMKIIVKESNKQTEMNSNSNHSSVNGLDLLLPITKR